MVSSNGSRCFNQSLWIHLIYVIMCHWESPSDPVKFADKEHTESLPAEISGEFDHPLFLKLHIPQSLVSYSKNFLCMSFCICLPLFITYMDGGRQVQKQTVQPPGSECDWVLCHPLNMCNRNGQNGGGVRAISIPSSVTMLLLAFILKATVNGKTLWNAWQNAWKIRTRVI